MATLTTVTTYADGYVQTVRNPYPGTATEACTAFRKRLRDAGTRHTREGNTLTVTTHKWVGGAIPHGAYTDEIERVTVRTFTDDDPQPTLPEQEN